MSTIFALAFCNSDLLFELDSAGEVTFAMSLTNAFTGQSAQDLKGVRIYGLLHEDDRRMPDRL